MFLIFTLAFGVTGCVIFDSQDSPIEYEDIYQPEQESDIDIVEEIDFTGQLPGKIAIATPMGGPMALSLERSFAARQLLDKYGEDSLIHFTFPSQEIGRFERPPREIVASVVDEIIANDEIKILITHTVDSELFYYFISGVQLQRSDIFVIFLSDTGNNFHLNSRADLIFDVNRNELLYSIIEQAKSLGAENFVAFVYDHELEYGFEPDDFPETNWGSEHIEEVDRIRIRAKEIGLNIVEVRYAGIGCMSDLNQYIQDTVPGLVETLGINTAFFGLSDDRLLWESVARGTIYPSSFNRFHGTPSPQFIASELFIPSLSEIASVDNAQFFHRDNLRFIIEETRKYIASHNMLGRVSTWPVSAQDMFLYAAVEYGFMLLNGEVSDENVDLEVLSQIMNNYIYRYTGEYGLGVNGTLFTADGVNFPNHILFLMGFLVY